MIRRVQVFNGAGALMAQYTTGAPEPPALAFEWRPLFAKAKSPADRQKLSRLRTLIAALADRVRHVPSPELRSRLEAYLSRAFNFARMGDLDSAMALLGTVEGILNESDKIVARIRKQIDALSGNGVQGPAGQWLAQMGKWLQMALAGAASLDDLNHIEVLGARALEIGSRFQGLSPNSRAYHVMMRDFEFVVRDLLERVPDGELRESLRTNLQVSARVMQEMAGLKARFPGAESQRQLAQLEQLLMAGIAAGQRGPAVEASVGRLLALVGEQKLDQALREAHTWVQRQDQMARLGRHLDIQLKRVGDRLAQDALPAQATQVRALLADLAKQRAAAESPQALLAIDKTLVQLNASLAKWSEASDPLEKQALWQTVLNLHSNQPVKPRSLDTLALSQALKDARATLQPELPAVNEQIVVVPKEHQMRGDALDLVKDRLARFNLLAQKQLDPVLVSSFAQTVDQQRQLATDAVDLTILAHRIDTIIRSLEASRTDEAKNASLKTIRELAQSLT